MNKSKFSFVDAKVTCITCIVLLLERRRCIFHAITIYVAKLCTMKDIKDRGEGYGI